MHGEDLVGRAAQVIFAAPRNRRRSHAGSEMAPSRHPKNRRPTTSSEDSGQRQYCTSLVETDGIQLAGESQAAGIGKQEPAAATGTQPPI
jgi:hypothetical protein